MRNMLSALAPILALGALLAPAFTAAEQTAKTIRKGSWTGMLVEETCSVELGSAKASAMDHNACAAECLTKGRPLGIITDDDGYMRIIGNASKDKYAKLTQYLGKRITLTGEVSPPPATNPTTAMNLVHANYKPLEIDIVKIAEAR
jgi:hypothetical protein